MQAGLGWTADGVNGIKQQTNKKFLVKLLLFLLSSHLSLHCLSAYAFKLCFLLVCIVSVPCSLVVTCWERADLLAVVFVVFCYFPKCVLIHI